MDFSTLKKLIKNNTIETIDSFKENLFLIFSNAMKFNPSETIYHKEAKRLQRVSEDLINMLNEDSNDEQKRHQRSQRRQRSQQNGHVKREKKKKEEKEKPIEPEEDDIPQEPEFPKLDKEVLSKVMLLIFQKLKRYILNTFLIYIY